MCGINGIFGYTGKWIDPVVLLRTRDSMLARGPDGFGEWLEKDGRVGFGHRRLSIIDLSPGGAQPMSSADGKIIVTFNGEIYNYRILRAELEAKGCIFQSKSDTEVLIHLYRLHGTEMLSRLRGMFAFGIWDAARETLFLARDPYGIKPLYYADDGNKFQFASSVKALISGGDVSREPDPAGVVGFQIFGYVPEPWTTFRAVKALTAGSFITVDRTGTISPVSFFSLAGTYCDAETRGFQDADAEAFFRASLLDCVKQHLVADVPVGAFLSAGVDSGALVGLMRDAGQNEIRTVTLAYDAYKGTQADESGLARDVARQYGASHTIRRVGAREFFGDLPKIIEAMDQPSIDGVNTWFVSKATREIGLKVAISGVGGDELVGGYTTFSNIPKLVRQLRRFPDLPGMERLIGALAGLVRKVGLPVHPKFAGLLAYGRTYPGAYFLQRAVHLPSEVRALLTDQDFVTKGLNLLRPLELVKKILRPEPRQPFGKIATLESSLYLRNQLLRDTDWAGMAHSLEIRTPLVDSVLLKQVAPIFAGGKRVDGKELLARAPSKPLPSIVTRRAKTGFGIPIKSWHASSEASADLISDTAFVGNPNEAGVSDRLWSRAWLQHVAKMYNQNKPFKGDKAV